MDTYPLNRNDISQIKGETIGKTFRVWRRTFSNILIRSTDFRCDLVIHYPNASKFDHLKSGYFTEDCFRIELQ